MNRRGFFGRLAACVAAVATGRQAKASEPLSAVRFSSTTYQPVAALLDPPKDGWKFHFVTYRFSDSEDFLAPIAAAPTTPPAMKE